jgi:SAM-dependent methyltransferase
MMKVLLNFFPRTFLIRMSLLIRPLLKLWYRGNLFEDPIDGSRYRKFLPYGYGKILRPNALCPGTLSLERHRLLWLYLTRNTSLLQQPLKVLHVAPEQVFYKKFRTLSHWEYITTDLNSPLADVKADLCDLPFEENEFDVVFCNHVLEHITNDHLALSEICRVLKKGGIAFLQTPINQNSDTTDEDASLTDPKERAARFGQYDHVRYYGRDFLDRIAAVGLKAEGIDVCATLDKEEIQRYALPEGEWLPIGKK